MTANPVRPTTTTGRRLDVLVRGGALIALMGLSPFMAGCRGNETPVNDPGQEAGPATAEAPAAGRAVLYYVAESGMALVASEQEVPVDAGMDSLTRARTILEHQLAQAPPPLMSPFPPGTELRAIYLTPEGDAFVDLNLEVTREHGGGSLDELFTVYALVNALTTNVPEISAVQILVEGREVDTLAGHIDLRRPLEGDLKWVAGSSGDPESPDPIPNSSEDGG